jgi:hypothetical protein
LQRQTLEEQWEIAAAAFDGCGPTMLLLHSGWPD